MENEKKLTVEILYSGKSEAIKYKVNDYTWNADLITLIFDNVTRVIPIRSVFEAIFEEKK
jgi:hypothetical protein